MKIHINQRPESYLDELYVFQRPGDKPGDIGYALVIENGVLLEKTVQRGDSFPPFITLPTDKMRDLVAAFVSYARDKGFKDNAEAMNEGKLIATERHLADMRTLLKLK